MEKIDLNEYLASNEYPGRGIAVAMAPDGRQMFIGYFIMGRSENSRNRVFDPIPERGGICTVAADPDKLEDPSLIIYNPVLTLGKTQIVTNGDQTDTIYDLMSRGKSFADALRPRQPPWYHTRPVERRSSGEPRAAQFAGWPALPHPVRAGLRCAGHDAGRCGPKIR